MKTTLRQYFDEPRDIAAFAALRILFGGMMAFSLIRFMANGWIEKVYVEPSFFFKYPGFEWVVVGSPFVLYAHFSLTAAAAALVALGLFYRIAIIVFWLGFAYIQLLDVTLYLNHYYLVILVSGVMVFLPLNGTWSLDGYIWPTCRRSVLPSWVTYLFRMQVGLVYFYAAVAKAQPDWLIYGQPLTIWIRARTEVPIIGPLLEFPYAGFMMSWMGFLYDLTITGFLLWGRSRAIAYLVVLIFHGCTALLFEIGMFPIIMVVLTTVFFDSNWPRRILHLGLPEKPASKVRTPTFTFVILGLYALLQISLPLRHYALPGDVLWNERGMRFAWKVMVREKNGSITYRVKDVSSGRTLEISALRYLTWRQFSDMSGQPDLILQLGHYIRRDYERRMEGPVEVRVDAWVSLNGRTPHRLVDPEVDIQTIGTSTGLDTWILPGPSEPPLVVDKKARP